MEIWRKKTPERPRRRWENIIVLVEGIGWEVVDWIDLAHYRAAWWSIMDSARTL